MDPERFGAFIQSRRRELGLTQADLAEKLHVTAKAVSRWERGVGFPDIKTLEPLAAALDVSITELMQSRRLTPAETDALSVKTVELIREQETLSQRRKMTLRAGQAVFLIAVLFLLRVVRTTPWVEPWLGNAVRVLVLLGGFAMQRMWAYILEKGYLKDRPFGIWHNPHTWVWASLAVAGAWILTRVGFANSAGGYVLMIAAGFLLIVAALIYYARHEYD